MFPTLLYGTLAHHGSTGRYDAGTPLYVQGRIIEARYGYPHGMIRLSVPANLTVPRNLPDVRQLGGYERWNGTPQPEGAGQEREVLLPPDITGELAGMSSPPGEGDEISAVVYQRCGDGGDQWAGELRVQMLYVGNASHRYGGRFLPFVDRCREAVRRGGRTTPTPTSAAPTVTRSGSPAAAPAADNDPPWLLLGGGTAVAAGFVIALLRLRMRRTGGE